MVIVNWISFGNVVTTQKFESERKAVKEIKKRKAVIVSSFYNNFSKCKAYEVYLTS